MHAAFFQPKKMGAVKTFFVKQIVSYHWPVGWQLIQGGGLILSGNKGIHSLRTLV